MKNRLLLLILASCMLFLWSCKKEENKIFFEGGTPPVFSASSTGPLVLTSGNANNQAIKFSWTNPDYRFNTGVSSQDVHYVLQVDVAGNNFAGADMQEIAIPRDLSLAYTVKELNQIPTRMNLAEDVPHNLEFRIKSTLINNTVPLLSNVISITITPYLDVAVPVPPSGELYITGSAVASDWTNSPPAGQRFTKISNTLYEIVVSLKAGAEYKFLSTLGFWQPQYGGSSAAGGDLGFNMGLPGQSDPPAIPSPAEAGAYKITVNFKTGKYTVVKQ
jgi:starch-binding outer membrane protein SusE/F